MTGETVVDTVTAGVTATPLDYCEYVDEGRAHDFAELFAEDGEFAESSTPAVGRAHIEKRFRRLVRSLAATSHHLSNVRVEPGPDARTATASSYMYAWHERLDGSQFEIWGRYQDSSRLEGDGRWRFVRRQIIVAGGRGIDVVPFARVATPCRR